jgi:predicted enzyme related to lactoylglutathione lyase
MKNALTWFEIPVTNLDRAAAFYEAVFGVTLWRDTVAGTPHAIFPVAEGGITGALVTRAPRRPARSARPCTWRARTRLQLSSARGTPAASW